MSSDVATATACLEKPDEGCRWAEGPASFPAGRDLVWSDIPNDCVLRFDEVANPVRVLRSPAGHTNGNAVARQGRLVGCEHGDHRVSRTEHGGSATSPASHHNGKRLNSPDDVVVRSDGSIRYTDPAQGIDSDCKRHK
jgi:gluconolactonase